MAMILEDRRVDEYRYYSAQRIDWMLRHWPEICTLAESPSSAEGLLIAGPTPESPRISKQPGQHGNPMRWCDVKADIERAQRQLQDRQQSQAIKARMSGVLLASIGIVLGVRNAEALAIYHAGLESMSRGLGGVDT